MILEACVETIEEAIRAEMLGAHRIELCADLQVGGTTPSYALLESVLGKLKIPVMVMIRPRGGNFVYDPLELKSMKQSIEVCKSLKVKGVVFGILDRRNHIDQINTSRLAEYAAPLEVTFHKAIDDTADLISSAGILIRIPGVTRILTSGGMATALEGADVINKMIDAAGDAVKVLAAGRITKYNLGELSKLLNTDEFHGRRIVGDLKQSK